LPSNIIGGKQKAARVYIPFIFVSYFVGDSRRYYPVNFLKKVSSEQWSGSENQWVTSAHPFYFEIICKITETLFKFNELIKRYYYSNKPITFSARL